MSADLIRKRKRPNLFTNDGMLGVSILLMEHTITHALCIVRALMYAFGDVSNPDRESVAVLEDILTDYIVDMVCYC